MVRGAARHKGRTSASWLSSSPHRTNGALRQTGIAQSCSTQSQVDDTNLSLWHFWLEKCYFEGKIWLFLQKNGTLSV